MPTHDFTLGGSNKPPAHAYPGSMRIDREIDCFNHNIASGDVVQLFNVPAKAFVVGVGYEVLEAEGDTLTIDVGLTGTDVDGFLDGINGNAVGSGVSMEYAVTLTEGTPNTRAVNPAYGQGKYFSATDTIDALFNNAAAKAKIRFSLFLMFNG